MADGQRDPSVPVCAGRSAVAHEPALMNPAWVCPVCGEQDDEPGRFVEEGWWHPNVKGGQVHDHTASQPAAMHRLCEPVYTRRPA